MFYKVAIRKDGAVASCAVISESFEDGKEIFCVEASSPAEAIKGAKALWLARYERHKAIGLRSSKKIRNDLRQQGLCYICRKPAVEGTTRCKPCAKKAADRARDVRAGIGSPVRKRAVSVDDKIRSIRRQVENVRKANAKQPLRPRDQYRLKFLKQTLADFRRLSPPNCAPKYEGHLVSQIYELENKNRHEKNPQAAE